MVHGCPEMAELCGQGEDLASLVLGVSRAETSCCINKMMLQGLHHSRIGGWVFPLQVVFYDNMKVYKL